MKQVAVVLAVGVVALTMVVRLKPDATYAQQESEARLKPDATNVPAPAFAARELTQYPTTGWLTNGGDLYNRRYSPLAQITRDNAAQLQAAWRTRLGGAGGG